MTHHPCTHARSTDRQFRSLEQRLDMIDQKLEYLIWKVPDSSLTVGYDRPCREPADTLANDTTDSFKYEDD